MLQAIRDRATGIVAWVIVIGIVIVFATWGIGNYIEPDANPEIAVVNDVQIEAREFERIYQSERQRLAARLQGRSQLPDEKVLRKVVIDNVIDEELLNQAAKEASLYVGDGQLMASLEADPSFQVDGRFDPERYRSMLQASGFSPDYFEHSQRAAMMREQWRRGIMSSALLPDQQLARVAALLLQERELRMATIDVAALKDDVTVADEEIAARYRANSEAYRTEDLVQVAYLDLNARDLAKDVAVSEAELRGWYEDHIAQYRRPEVRYASHILLEVPPEADETKEAELRAQLEQFAEQIRAGQSFAELAKAHSQDPGSAASGGDLGPIERGMMLPEFEEALFKLEEGAISEPVRTRFGWHLIQLSRIEPETTQSFDEARPQVERELRRHLAEDRFYELSDTLTDLTYQMPDSLAPAAEALRVDVQTSEFFNRRGGPGIAAERAVVEAAFSPEVLEEKLNSAPIDLGANHVVVLRLRDRQPPRQQTLEEVSDTIRETLRQEKAEARALEIATAMEKALAEGAELATVAEQYGARFEDVGWVKRDARNLGPAVVNTVFRMPHPTEVASVAHADTPTGDVAILAVRGVRDGKLEAISEAERDALRQQLHELAGARDFQAFLDGLRQTAAVKIFEENLYR